MIDLGTLGGLTSEAVDMNERGQVIGVSTTASGAQRAFLWQGGKMSDLGMLGKPSADSLRQRIPESEGVAINDRGQVVGTSWTAGGARHAFLWEQGRMRDLGALGGGQSSAEAINNAGQVVGSSRTRDDPHVFLWQNGKMIDLGTLGGAQSYAWRSTAEARSPDSARPQA